MAEKNKTFKPTIEGPKLTMQELADKVNSLGVDVVAKQAGLTERVVRKFTVDSMASKLSDIAKIKAAIKVLSEN
jgi:hypothetical protein